MLGQPDLCCLPPGSSCPHDERAIRFYRPMATCRMLHQYDWDEFCDVCTYELTEAITDGSRGPSQACLDANPLP